LIVQNTRSLAERSHKQNKPKNIMKKIIALIASALLATPLAMAQVETGTSAGAQALDMARSGPISAGRTTSETVTVSDYKTAGGKEIVVVEEDEKWWSVNASTGWDSLYMFRGVNVLGNGNGLYWLGADLTITPWENGALSAGVWYGVGSHWNGANQQSGYGELDVFADYTHSFGNLDLTVGWVYYWYPTFSQAQNEIFFAAAYNIEIGSITITPNTAYYYNVGPEAGSPGGVVAGGASWWQMGVSAAVPVAYDGAVSLAPYTQFGLNFRVNGRAVGNSPFTGGNNWQSGVAMPVQFTSWFSVSPYIAYSYQWQNLPAGIGTGTGMTAINTFWGGVSANFSF
jgi:hypothetical protein